MINRADALECFEKELFGGPGAVHFTKIVNENGLAGKGRLFNIGTLKPGCAVGNHKHNGEIEIYYILEGEGMILCPLKMNCFQKHFFQTNWPCLIFCY